MKANIKKIVSIISSGAMALTLSFTAVTSAFADYRITGSRLGHSNDDWKYGQRCGIYGVLIDSYYQFSNFYCKNQKHTATAIQKNSEETQTSKDTAKKGKWAKAETDYLSDLLEWNSYYNHID